MARLTKWNPVQINNLKIVYSRLYRKWQVKSPDRRVLEEFRQKVDAVKWARKTKDFTARR